MCVRSWRMKEKESERMIDMVLKVPIGSMAKNTKFGECANSFVTNVTKIEHKMFAFFSSSVFCFCFFFFGFMVCVFYHHRPQLDHKWAEIDKSELLNIEHLNVK